MRYRRRWLTYSINEILHGIHIYLRMHRLSNSYICNTIFLIVQITSGIEIIAWWLFFYRFISLFWNKKVSYTYAHLKWWNLKWERIKNDRGKRPCGLRTIHLLLRSHFIDITVITRRLTFLRKLSLLFLLLLCLHCKY